VDLNQLYFDHQMLLMKAQAAPAGQRRCQHAVSASHVAERIGHAQRELGAGGATGWEAAAQAGRCIGDAGAFGPEYVH
jgi:hypothetical protein